jgi:plasmid stabilization system protein ParE
MYKLQYSRLALLDLKEIEEYISEESLSSDVAENVVMNILDTVKKLESFPEIGTQIDKFVPFVSDYRMLVADNYLVFYRLEESNVYIDRIIHSRRNYIRILFGG